MKSPGPTPTIVIRRRALDSTSNLSEDIWQSQAMARKHKQSVGTRTCHHQRWPESEQSKKGSAFFTRQPFFRIKGGRKEANSTQKESRTAADCGPYGVISRALDEEALHRSVHALAVCKHKQPLRKRSNIHTQRHMACGALQLMAFQIVCPRPSSPVGRLC